MPNSWFRFKQFKVWQNESAFKVGTDGVLLGAWCSVNNAVNILDIGTGTGLIALMLAQRSKANITGIEPDTPSSMEAECNVSISPWSDRIEIVNSSLKDFTTTYTGRFDLIVSNPPFFSNSLINPDIRLSKARHNYSLSTRELLECTSELLSDNGILSVILPYAEGNLFIAEATDYHLYCNKVLNVKPLPDRAVKRVLLEFSHRRSKPESGFLTIETGARHDYSHEYRELTKEFYLNF